MLPHPYQEYKQPRTQEESAFFGFDLREGGVTGIRFWDEAVGVVGCKEDQLLERFTCEYQMCMLTRALPYHVACERGTASICVGAESAIILVPVWGQLTDHLLRHAGNAEEGACLGNQSDRATPILSHSWAYLYNHKPTIHLPRLPIPTKDATNLKLFLITASSPFRSNTSRLFHHVYTVASCNCLLTS